MRAITEHRSHIETIAYFTLLLFFMVISAVSLQAQVPEGEKETMPGFMEGLDYLTHPVALRTVAERIVASSTPDGIIAALDKTLADTPPEEDLYCWGRTFESLIESSRNNIELAEARLSDATRLHAPTGVLRAVVAVARREIYAARTYAKWPVYESAHFRIHYPTDLSFTGDMESHTLPHDNTFEKICRFFEYEMADKIDFYLYKDNKQCVELTGFVLSYALPEKKEIHGSLIDSLGHEQAHIISMQIAGKCGRKTMMGEGIATYLDETLPGRHEKTCKYFDREEMLPVREMLGYFRRFPQDMTYTQAGSFLGFLIELYGRARFLELWKSNERYDDAFMRIYGFSVDEAETRWKKFLIGKAAEYREFNSYNKEPAKVHDRNLAAALAHDDGESLRYAAGRYMDHMPRYSYSHYLAGIVHMSDGEYEEAVKELEQTLEIYPRPGWQVQDALLRLVRCQYALGNLKEASRRLDEALKLPLTLQSQIIANEYAGVLPLWVDSKVE